MEYHSHLENLDEDGYTQLDFKTRGIHKRPVRSEKGSQVPSPPWRLIAAALGILCLVALVVAAVLGVLGFKSKIQLPRKAYCTIVYGFTGQRSTTKSAIFLHSVSVRSSCKYKDGDEEIENETPSSVWRPVALTLLTLCLVLLIGLAALGLVFFQFYQLSNTQQDSIAEKDERLGNVSRQLQSLQIQNRKLMETLQQVAVKLCRELYNKSGGHRCSPCPEKWKWHGDKCYQFYKESKNWQGCEYFCLTENATMLKISTQEELDFAMPQSYSEFFYSYWTGLSRNGSGKVWLWTDGTSYSFEL
ncbi:hypothetical protein STEG23_036923, partial [Scotinomys teguina]